MREEVEKFKAGRRQPVGQDEGERGGEERPSDQDNQGQVGFSFEVGKIFSTGTRTPWLVVFTVCFLSMSPQTLASTFLAILTWHRGIKRGMVLVLNLYIIAQVSGGPTLSEVYKRFKSYASTGKQKDIRPGT